MQADGQDGCLAVGGIAERDAGAAGYGDGGRGELAELLLLFVREGMLQYVAEVDFFEVVCFAQLIVIWAEPGFVAGEQGFGAYVGPGLFGVPVAEAEYAVLPGLYVGVEIEQVLAFGFDGATEHLFELWFVGHCEGAGLQHDAADAEIGAGEKLLFAAVPADVLGFFGEVYEVLRVEWGGDEDFALPFPGVELGDGEPGFVCEVVVAVDAGGLSVC